MEKTIRLLFNLYPGEGKKVSLFLFLGLLWGIGNYGTLTLSEGLFVEHVGIQGLPSVYFWSSIFSCSCALFILYSLSKRKISSSLLFLFPIVLTLVFNLIFLILTCYFPTSILPRVYFFYRLFGWSLTILAFTAFWTFTDEFFNLQDGKRFFSIFNAVIFLGDAIGNGVISLINVIGIKGILCFFSLCSTFAIPLVFVISKQLNFLSKEHSCYIDKEQNISIKQSISIVSKSKFSICLIAFYFCMQLLAILTEYNYLDVFQKIFFSPEKPYNLTRFLSLCGIWISVGNMIFAFTAYSRIVKKIGINNIIIIAPILFLCLFSIWLKYSCLFLATLSVIAREGLIYALDDNNLQLLISGVPNKLRSHIRIFIESFIEPIGMLFCSGLCFIFSNTQIFICFSISLITTFLVLLLRHFYPKAIFSNLSYNKISFDKELSVWLSQLSNKEKRLTEIFLLLALRKQDEKEQLVAFQHLLKINNPSLLPRLLNHINKFSLPRKILAIEILRESKSATAPLALELLERWRKSSPHPAIQSAIQMYLSRHCLLNPINVIQDLDNPCLYLKIAAILTIRKKTSTSSVIYQKAEGKIHEILSSNNLEEVCAGIKLLGFEGKEEYLDILINFLESSSDTKILKASSFSLHQIITPEHTKYTPNLIFLLEKIKDETTQNNILKSLSKIITVNNLKNLLLASKNFRPKERAILEKIIISLGPIASPILLTILYEDEVHDRIRISCAKILRQIDSNILRKNNYRIIKKEIDKAYFYAYHQKYIQQAYPHLNLNLLVMTLEINYCSSIDFIIQLLGISGTWSADPNILTMSLKNYNSKTRAQALEFLQKMCGNNIFSFVEPLLNKEFNVDVTKYYIKSYGSLFPLSKLLTIMLKSPFGFNQVVAKKLQEEFITKEKNYEEISVYQVNNQSKKEQKTNFAYN